MGDGIEQGGTQLFAFAGGLGAAEFFDGSGALNRDRDQAAHRVQGFAGKQRAGNAHAADDTDAHPKRHEHCMLLGTVMGSPRMQTN